MCIRSDSTFTAKFTCVGSAYLISVLRLWFFILSICAFIQSLRSNSTALSAVILADHRMFVIPEHVYHSAVIIAMLVHPIILREKI